MDNIEVRLLGEHDGLLYRDVRLAALRDAPEAFIDRFEDEASHSEEYWREAVIRALRIVAEREGEPVGVVSLGLHDEDPENGAVFGLWTAPALRHKRVAARLVATAAQKATEDGRKFLYFWAGLENGSAVGFASGFGFRPTDQRRPVRVADGGADGGADNETYEVAMELSLMRDLTQAGHPHTWHDRPAELGAAEGTVAG